MNALAPLGLVLSTLDAAGIDHMVVGSMASTHYGPVRATQDIDLVIDAGSTLVDRLLAQIDRDRFYVPDEAARDAAGSQGQFNVIDLASPWKFDLMLLTDHPWDQQRFARRTRADLGGIDVWMTTPEDIVLAKLLWGRMSESSRQLEDAAGVLSLIGPSADVAYLETWANRLGVAVDLRQIRPTNET
jgi:hypothetical protein